MDDIERQAQWLRDAIGASKEAADYAKRNYSKDFVAPRESVKRSKSERSIEFHESESGKNADVMDALLDAMKWHMPPEEFREYTLFAQIQRLNKEIETLREKAAREEQQRKSLELALSISRVAVDQYASDDSEDDDYD